MRLVRLLVSTSDLETVAGVLDDERVDFVVTEEYRSDDRVLVEFPLPVQAVEAVLDALRDADVDVDTYSVVASAEAARTEHFADLEERFVEGTEDDDSIAHEEIRSKARSLLPDRLTYYAMTALSALVATAGLLLDSPAVVIGSMAIAPQVGAALTSSVGTVVGDDRMVVDGVLALVFGLVFAVVSATGASWLLVQGGFFPPALDVTTVEQVSTRISPGFLTLMLGLCAGAAAAFGVATDLPLSLVGVAIAAAVVPAAAAVGIGLVWAIPTVAVGATTLLVVNTASILLACTGTLWYLGYRPEGWTAWALRANFGRRQTLHLLATTLVLLAVFAVPVVAMTEHVTVENTANGAVQDTLEQPGYRELSLLSVETEFKAFGLLGGPREVRLTVGRPADVAYPDLDRDVAETISERTGHPVSVTVEFVDQSEYATDRGGT